MSNPVFVAVDTPDVAAARALVAAVAPHVGGVKLGLEFFCAHGRAGIAAVMEGQSLPLFLDLKLHDIPNTVAKAVAAAVRLDVQMLTVHCSGGTAMMKAAETAAQETAAGLGRPAPLVLGVTVLTSMDTTALAELGGETDITRQVERLARLAATSGLMGLVCSPLEITPLRAILPASMQLVTPGIRTGAEKSDDQKRTLGPAEALSAGANWLVIGRPIYAAADPVEAARKMYEATRSGN